MSPSGINFPVGYSSKRVLSGSQASPAGVSTRKPAAPAKKLKAPSLGYGRSARPKGSQVPYPSDDSDLLPEGLQSSAPSTTFSKEYPYAEEIDGKYAASVKLRRYLAYASLEEYATRSEAHRAALRHMEAKGIGPEDLAPSKGEFARRGGSVILVSMEKAEPPR